MATGEVVDDESLGGAAMHTKKSGTPHLFAAMEAILSASID